MYSIYCFIELQWIFGHEKITGITESSLLTILDVHAAEIIVDEDGDYYISSVFYTENGVSVAPLKWE